MLRTVLAVSGALAWTIDTACYAYVPATTSAPTSGADVRVQLNNDGTVELARYLGPRVTSVDGKLTSTSADGAMVVAPSAVQVVDGSRQRWTGDETVVLPQRYVAGVQLRTIDRRKSTIAAAVIAASLVTAGAIAMRVGNSSAPTETGPGTGVFSRR